MAALDLAPIVILDRDGVINYDSAEYIKHPDEWLPIPGSLEAIARLTQAGIDVHIATNQAGVARGKFTAATLTAIHEKMLTLIRDAGGDIVSIAFCPHHPDDNCDCRKPRPGMLQQISSQTGVPLTGVPFVGDSLKDVEAARAAGCRPIVVLTGNGQHTHAAAPGAEVFDSLLEFVKNYLNQ